ncbi:hypothetical protein niasHT_003318 [Heterodera trifolii]|uniref:BTB domain-containing protein n=1 Tax=Heterodera trifolii TaxID=157864 RepID=A0ABD2LXV0_9BILA
MRDLRSLDSATAGFFCPNPPLLIHILKVLPAHKHILKNASDVFEAMFRFDSQNGKSENVSVNCPAVVEIPDIDAAAFKVMLSFIYTGDLSELNGDNAMAVLYAAKKYNIPALVDASLQIPISELRNIFLAYAQALLFELEDFSIKCLRYICQNAIQLFGSNDFLQIDQKMLCNLLDRDRLLLNNEFEIWKAALRWADEKCCQNGIECSSENRRSLLGPALFKIRFPNIHEENFANYVVPSGVLTMEEVLGVYQFNSHPFLYLHGIPGLYSLKFPSHGRIFDWNKAKDNRRGTLALDIEKELMDPRNGFYDQNEDKVTLAIDVTVKDEKTEKLILDQSKPRGTLSMEIGKMSEFSREINWRAPGQSDSGQFDSGQSDSWTIRQ